MGTSKYAAMAIGFAAKADANLNCTITLTGKDKVATQLNIFSLEGVHYDFQQWLYVITCIIVVDLLYKLVDLADFYI